MDNPIITLGHGLSTLLSATLRNSYNGDDIKNNKKIWSDTDRGNYVFKDYTVNAYVDSADVNNETTNLLPGPMKWF